LGKEGSGNAFPSWRKGLGKRVERRVFRKKGEEKKKMAFERATWGKGCGGKKKNTLGGNRGRLGKGRKTGGCGKRGFFFRNGKVEGGRGAGGGGGGGERAKERSFIGGKGREVEAKKKKGVFNSVENFILKKRKWNLWSKWCSTKLSKNLESSQRGGIPGDLKGKVGGAFTRGEDRGGS